MRANGQFELFLRRFKGHPAASWHACTPELVLTHLRTDVAGRSGRSGGAIAASTLRQCVSNLSMCFARRGLAKPWDELVSTGNPVLSQTVRGHVEVMERQQHAAPRQSHSTSCGGCYSIWIPAPLRRWSVTTAWIGRAALRDACMVALLWHSCRRGADLLRLGVTSMLRDATSC